MAKIFDWLSQLLEYDNHTSQASGFLPCLGHFKSFMTDEYLLNKNVFNVSFNNG